tara:strand:- start:341 stop:529 length:189 start_codon:yes stop_codon:yes gene_type:complete
MQTTGLQMSNENSLADVDIDQYEKDLIIETLQYRLEHDDHLIQEMTLKDNLEDLMSKLEGEE